MHYLLLEDGFLTEKKETFSGDTSSKSISGFKVGLGSQCLVDESYGL